MTNRGKTRALALVMTLALMLGLLPAGAFAAGEGPPCENHPEHTAGCGYAEAEGSPCGHACPLCAAPKEAPAESPESPSAAGSPQGRTEAPPEDCSDGLDLTSETEDKTWTAGVGTAEWDYESKTLTLTDATIHNTGGNGIYYEGSDALKVVVRGNCSVTAGGNLPLPTGILGAAGLTVEVQADASLTVQGSSAGLGVGYKSSGGQLLSTEKIALTVNVAEGGRLTALGENGIRNGAMGSSHPITLRNGGTLLARGSDFGVTGGESSVTLSGNGVTLCAGGDYGVRAGTGVTVETGVRGLAVGSQGGLKAEKGTVKNNNTFSDVQAALSPETLQILTDLMASGGLETLEARESNQGLTLTDGLENAAYLYPDGGVAHWDQSTKTLALNGVTIDVSNTSNACALALDTNVEATIILSGENVLTSGDNCAGLEVPGNSKVTITSAAGDGSTGGSLTATGGSNGTGIGGGKYGVGGAVTIKGGTVTATGGIGGTYAGAGIGGGTGGGSGTVTLSPEAGKQIAVRAGDAANNARAISGSPFQANPAGHDVTDAVKNSAYFRSEAGQAPPPKSTITMAAVPGVTAPARGAAPVTKITDTEQYTGVVAWSPDPGVAFAAGTAYTATITLTPKDGYTLQGVAANFFTVAGATAANGANSGVIQAVFPKTGVAYPVTVSGGTGGGSYEAGETVTIQASVPDGQRFTGWTFRPEVSFTEGGKNTATAKFTMPAQAVMAAAGFESTGGGGGGSDRDDGPSATDQAVSKVDKAKDGERVEIKLPSGGKLDGTLLEAAAGKDVTLEISAGKGVTWIVNGLDIPSGKLADLNLKVDAKANTIPVTVINTVTGEQKVMQLALSHNGEFPMPLTLRLETGKDNAGLFANLYYYNETAKELEYQTTAKIGPDGNADIPFAHASSYAVVIDKESHAPVTEPEWENPFADVGENDWYYEAVAYVHQQGLMVGTTDTTFGPDRAVTRAQVWTVLARLAGQDTTGGDPWYAPARDWAVANGVSDGTDPDGAVTREQLVTMLYRYAQSTGMDVSVGGDTNILSYNDAFAVSEWAISAFQWACGSGIVSGTGETALSPQAGADRAQLAAILMRFLEST